MRGEFGLGLGTLHGNHLAAIYQQREAPSHQTVEWRYCPSSHPLGLADSVKYRTVLRPPPYDLHLIHQAELVHNLIQEVNPASEWLHQINPKFWTGECQRNPWETGAGSNVHDPT